MTGKTASPTKPSSMAQWAQVVRDAGITGYDEARQWLRAEHGLTANYAMMADGDGNLWNVVQPRQ